MSELGTRFHDADDSTGLQLWRVTNRWQAAQRAALKPLGLTHVQFVLLASLTWLHGPGREGDEPVTQQALAGHASTDPMMTSQVLRTLETQGLVTRARHPADGRARALAVTDAGRALAQRAVRVVEAVDESFFGTLDGELRRSLTRALTALARLP